MASTSKNETWSSNSIRAMSKTKTIDTSSNPYRLPHTVVPSAYRLCIDVDLDGATFEGSVDIDVDFKVEVTSFALNGGL
jgi:hypothetical protein